MKPEEIKSIRKTLKLTQKQFAEKLDVTDRTVRLWEKGDKSPGKRSLKDLCKFKLATDIFTAAIAAASHTMAELSKSLEAVKHLSPSLRGGVIPPVKYSGEVVHVTEVAEMGIVDDRVLKAIAIENGLNITTFNLEKKGESTDEKN